MVHRIRNAKRSFYRNSINNNLENPKNLCRIIRSIAHSKCSKLPNHLTIDGKSYHDYHNICISPIFLPLFSSVMCLSRPAGIGLPDMFAPMSNLEYRNVSPLLRKIFLELAFSSYLLVRLPGLMTLEVVF